MEIKDKRIDAGKAFDWGKTSEHYAKYRDIYPEEFYRRVVDRGLCITGQKVLDLGTGTGVLPRNMYRYGAEWIGTDISPNQIEQAKKLALESGMNIEFKAVSTEQIDFPTASFDVITSNPPYMIGQHGLTNPQSAKAIARHEIECTFDDVARVTGKLLKPGGKFYLVHRPFRLAEIFATLQKYKLEPKRMRLVYPFVDKEPNMVLIEAVRGGNSRMTVEKPLIIYDAPKVYNPEIRSIYGY